METQGWPNSQNCTTSHHFSIPISTSSELVGDSANLIITKIRKFPIWSPNKHTWFLLPSKRSMKKPFMVEANDSRFDSKTVLDYFCQTNHQQFPKEMHNMFPIHMQTRLSIDGRPSVGKELRLLELFHRLGYTSRDSSMSKMMI